MVNDQSIGEFCRILNLASKKRIGAIKGSVTQARNIINLLSSPAKNRENIILIIIAIDTTSSVAATSAAKKCNTATTVFSLTSCLNLYAECKKPQNSFAFWGMAHRKNAMRHTGENKKTANATVFLSFIITY